MPEWNLHYFIADLDSSVKCQLHFEALNKDPHVEGVHLATPPHSPTVRVLHVVFRDGWSQPLSPSLRHLNIQYPPREMTLGIDYATSESVSVEYAIRRFREATLLPSYRAHSEFSLPRKASELLPRWAQLGSWLVRSGVIYQVDDVSSNGSDIPRVTLKRWRSTLCMNVALEELIEKFKPTPKPAEPLSWHQRLLLEDSD